MRNKELVERLTVLVEANGFPAVMEALAEVAEDKNGPAPYDHFGGWAHILRLAGRYFREVSESKLNGWRG